MQFDENYAPVIRQGNHTLVGLAGCPTTWTPTYERFFHQMAQAVLSRATQEFVPVRREITVPGSCRFVLANAGNTTVRFMWEFFFQFQSSTQFTAGLAHDDSDHVMMMFHGSDVSTSRRVDTNGAADPLQISVEITEKEIRSKADGYWTLRISNFDRTRHARCDLTVDYSLQR